MIEKTHRYRFPAFACLLGVLIAWGSPAPASSVAQVSLQEMLQDCELVFEGRVVSEEVRTGAGKRAIFTFVTLEVLDVIKGVYPGDRIELRYLGGTLGDRSLQVTDLHLPSVGDKGIFFVETLGDSPAHPLYGWDQGHYRIVRGEESQGEIVMNYQGKPIFGIDHTKIRSKAGLSTGTASGLSLEPAALGSEPLSAQDFKQGLRDLLSEGAP